MEVQYSNGHNTQSHDASEGGLVSNADEPETLRERRPGFFS